MAQGLPGLAQVFVLQEALPKVLKEGARAALLCFPTTPMATLPLISMDSCPPACPTICELPGLNRVLLILETGMYVQ